MGEHERAFYSEYRVRMLPGMPWSEWRRVGGIAPVTYQEACDEVLEQVNDAKKVFSRATYENRIVTTNGLVVLEGDVVSAELLKPDEPARKIRDWKAEGYSEAEILRRWKIVDAMIEELDEEKADREETLTRLKEEVDAGNFYWIDVYGKLLVEQNDKIFELENWLKVGLEV